MAKDLPYFKWNAAEYLNGSITLEDFYVQGVFTNICSHYWFKSGCLTLPEIKRRVKCKEYAFTTLIDAGIIKLDGDAIRISFLDEQLAERGNISKINAINGSKGGAPIGNKNAIKDKPITTEKQPKTTNIEEKREEERRREENRKEAAEAVVCVWPTFDDFWDKYDKKVGKPNAEKLFKKIDQAGREKIMVHLDHYLMTEKQYRKDPERYLKHKTWEDEIITKQQNGHSKNGQPTPEDLARSFEQRVKQDFANGEFQASQ